MFLWPAIKSCRMTATMRIGTAKLKPEPVADAAGVAKSTVCRATQQNGQQTGKLQDPGGDGAVLAARSRALPVFHPGHLGRLGRIGCRRQFAPWPDAAAGRLRAVTVGNLLGAGPPPGS